MLKFWFVIYNVILVPVLWIIFKLLSIFNSKIKEGFKGRINLFEDLKSNLASQRCHSQTILIHSSSLGEFQQAIPLADALKEKSYNIVFSFFSPSGYNNSVKYLENHIITYLPFDSYVNAKRFLDILNPKVVILMRYDLWFNFLYLAKKRNIFVVIANARYDEKNWSWKLPLICSFKRTLYNLVDMFFVIDDSDEKYYKKEFREKVDVIFKVGDSKYERVYQASKKVLAEDVEKIVPSKVIENKKVFVVGSSWKEDEELILPVLNKIVKYEPHLLTFLVPHEPKETKLVIIERNISTKYENLKVIRLSKIQNYNVENIILVDTVGNLLKLYSIAYVSYVGGGFKSGLHNILEPVVFGVPVIYANLVKNSDENEFLESIGCGFVVNDQFEFYKIIRRLLSDYNYRNTIKTNCGRVFQEKLGTAEKIVQKIIQHL
ncbi:MAG: 3-deoxy-D-manno-octulosonic acid transferase [Ignavibacteria bacterium]